MNQDIHLEITAMMLIEQALERVKPENRQYVIDAVLERLSEKENEI